MDSGFDCLRDFSQGQSSLHEAQLLGSQPSLTTVSLPTEVNGDRITDFSRDGAQTHDTQMVGSKLQLQKTGFFASWDKIPKEEWMSTYNEI